ncbi:hypothetical protein K8T06_02200, partial [bacterium]|nr:hypothetical protein [bacterium]
VQQLRMVDARILGDNKRFVYDTRINVLYNAEFDKWDFISGMSRSVPCGPNVTTGNSLLTNITAGAEVSPLVMGHLRTKEGADNLEFGPILKAIMDGQEYIDF